MPVTAPRRTSACASSKLVSPTLYPGCRPSTATRTMRPSASWPTAERGARGPSWLVVNARRRGTRARRRGRSAARRRSRRRGPAQSGCRSSRTVRVCPDDRLGARAPRRPTPCRSGRRRRAGSATGASAGAHLDDRSPAGRRSATAAGNGNRTTAVPPGTAGVAGPQAEVKSAAPPAARPVVEPSQRPRGTGAMPGAAQRDPADVSVPSVRTPALDRAAFGATRQLAVPHEHPARHARCEARRSRR